MSREPDERGLYRFDIRTRPAVKKPRAKPHWLNPSDVPVFDAKRVRRAEPKPDPDPPILLFTNRYGMSPPRQVVTAAVLGDPPPGRRERMAAIQATEEREARERALAQGRGLFECIQWGK